MKNVIQAKAKEKQAEFHGNQYKSGLLQKSDKVQIHTDDELSKLAGVSRQRRKRSKQRLLGGLIPSFYRFLKKLNQSTPTKNFLSWLECPGINLESAQNAQISKVASGQNDAMPNRTRDIVAQNHSIGTKTVERAAQFS